MRHINFLDSFVKRKSDGIETNFSVNNKQAVSFNNK